MCNQNIECDNALPLQGYLKALLAACNKTEATGPPGSPVSGPVSGTKPSATARVGVKCLAVLLKALAHFNHAFDILQARAPHWSLAPMLSCVPANLLTRSPKICCQA